MFWIGLIVGALAVGVLGFLFLLWACDRAYDLGIRDCLKQLREQGFSVPIDVMIVEALERKRRKRNAYRLG